MRKILFGKVTLLGLFIALVASPASGQGREPEEPPAKEWSERRSPHYIVKTTAGIYEAEKLSQFMEGVYKAYTLVFNYGKGIPSPFVVKLYKNRYQFWRAGAPQDAGAYYNPSSRELVGYLSTKGEPLPYLTHEGFHQFNHMYFTTAYEEHLIPIWLDEGLADCLGNSEMKSGQLISGIRNGLIAQGRLRTIQPAIKKGKHYPLKKLITLDRNTFMNNAGLCYAQAWSFCHFLLAYPMKEDKKRVLPAGDYYHILDRLYEGFYEYGRHKTAGIKETRFESPQDIYDYAFQTKDKKPIDLDELEKQWKEYVLKFNEKEPKEQELENAAGELWEKVTRARERKDWTGLRSFLGELKEKYKDTDVYKENEFDITELANIAKYAREGKSEAYQLDLFSGKEVELKNWEFDDVEGNNKSWRLDKQTLIGQSENSFFMFPKETKLDWTITVSFKPENKKIIKGESPTQLMLYTFEADKAEAGYVGFRIKPSSSQADLIYVRVGQGVCLDGPANLADHYKKDDWNELALTKSGEELKGHLNGQEIIKYESKGGEIPERVGLQLVNGKVIIKSISLQLK